MLRKDWPILVVDDDPEFLEVMDQFLQNEGFDVKACPNGALALEEISKRDYALVISDLVMQPVSGEDIVKAVKKDCPGTEVIIITGYPSLGSTVEAIRFQVFDYLKKPLDFDKLVRTVDNAIVQHQLSLENERLISQLKQQEEVLRTRIDEVTQELEELSTTDALTGLYNYRYYSEVIFAEVSRSLRYNRPISLAMLDLDHFKFYNDTYGHQEGNKALQLVAGEMLSSVRDVDIVIRYGGEEFAILLPETDKKGARTIVSRVCECVRNLDLVIKRKGKETLQVTISGGLATCPEDADDAESLTQAADLALYRAKSLGKDRIVEYNPQLSQSEKAGE
jgi:diguanylate cyclase (GGDEF)-like protein